MLWFSYRHPEMPLLAKVLGMLVVGYAFSPIDLIPDFIPVLGLLDDVLLLPLGIWLCLRLTPAAIIEESREKAEQWMKDNAAKPTSRAAGIIIACIWAFLALMAAYFVYNRLYG